ncbi:MAG: formylmethanofuran dehydrogenase subunit E family protein [Methanocorpusculum sp.]|uniref:formylmethanofuran dehydrogenase subunit E family protein n=1 Tax=Methanocorpusculum sp. TaxID=2058474 RepID=UPI00271CE77C|nr:formylmethanofuran dehydrogenase subunit E family protein [Methanocorpusculum sp.]MDO9523733.1 formylmethanofuran dehydrogenase subunit E family protein [Methanocorpusculum sp.]
MKWHENCRYMELPREYSNEELAKFHGHLGPFIVLGYRMGKFALQYFDNDPFSLFATVYCSGTTPESCLLDGIQIGSGCTLGKRNIELVTSSSAEVMFRHADGRAILIKPGDYVKHKSDYDSLDPELALENFAEAMFSMEDSDLFVVTELR